MEFQSIFLPLLTLTGFLAILEIRLKKLPCLVFLFKPTYQCYMYSTNVCIGLCSPGGSSTPPWFLSLNFYISLCPWQYRVALNFDTATLGPFMFPVSTSVILWEWAKLKCTLNRTSGDHKLIDTLKAWEIAGIDKHLYQTHLLLCPSCSLSHITLNLRKRGDLMMINIFSVRLCCCYP